jgi:ureidoacrylate peracid hydrolase
MTHPTTRDLPVVPAVTSLLFIDVQNYCAGPDGGEFAHMSAAELEEKLGYFFREMETHVVPNMQRLQAGCRAAGIEVMYTIIRNLTRDGRDRSLDYKITGFSVPPDSWDGKVINAIAPGEDEIVIPKTSLCAAQSWHAASGDIGDRNRPVHRRRGAQRVRFRLFGDVD